MLAEDAPPPTYWEVELLKMRRDALLRELALIENAMKRCGLLIVTTAEIRKANKVTTIAIVE